MELSLVVRSRESIKFAPSTAQVAPSSEEFAPKTWPRKVEGSVSTQNSPTVCREASAARAKFCCGYPVISWTTGKRFVLDSEGASTEVLSSPVVTTFDVHVGFSATFAVNTNKSW